MSGRIEPPPVTRSVPDTVDELVTDVQWLATCDQVRAALRRVSLPVFGGSVTTELAAKRFGGVR